MKPNNLWFDGTHQIREYQLTRLKLGATLFGVQEAHILGVCCDGVAFQRQGEVATNSGSSD